MCHVTQCLERNPFILNMDRSTQSTELIVKPFEASTAVVGGRLSDRTY
jgi:hypothetical protein